MVGHAGYPSLCDGRSITVDSFFGFGSVRNASIARVQKVVDLGQRVVDLFIGFDDGSGGAIDVIE